MYIIVWETYQGWNCSTQNTLTTAVSMLKQVREYTTTIENSTWKIYKLIDGCLTVIDTGTFPCF